MKETRMIYAVMYNNVDNESGCWIQFCDNEKTAVENVTSEFKECKILSIQKIEGNLNNFFEAIILFSDDFKDALEMLLLNVFNKGKSCGLKMAQKELRKLVPEKNRS